MLEKRTYQLGVIADLLQLFLHAIMQVLALHQRPSGHARALGMAPDKFVRVQVWYVAGQKMQRQTPLRVSNIGLDDRLTVRRQAINDQMQRLLAAINQLLEQFDKQFTRQPALIGSKPERSLGIDRRGGAYALALSRSVDHRRFASLRPGLAMHGIGTKAGLVPETDFSARHFGLLGDSWKGIALPALNGLWIALIGSLQWLLRRQVEFGKQTACRGHAQADVEFLENELADDISCPQTKIKTIPVSYTHLDVYKRQS